MRRLGFVLVLVLLGAAAWWASACTRQEDSPPPRGGGAPPTPPGPSHDPREYASITQILLLYRAPGGAAEAVRTRDEAKNLADSLISRIKGGEPMETLLVVYTDDRVNGTVFNGGTQIVRMADASLGSIKRAVFALKHGELAREPVDTGRAFIVIRRDE